MNIVNGNTVDVDAIEQIVGEFEYSDEEVKKAATDAVNNSIFEESDLDELRDIAKSFSVGGSRGW